MEASLQSIVDHLPELVAITDPEGFVRFLNKTACRVLGFSNGDGTALPITDLFNESVRGEIPGGIETAVERGTWQKQTTMLASDGRNVPVTQKIIAHRNAEGAVESFSFVARISADALQAEKKGTSNRLKQHRWIDITQALLAAESRQALIENALEAARLLTGARLAIFCAPDCDGRFRAPLHSRDETVPKPEVDRLMNALQCDQIIRLFGENLFLRLSATELANEPSLLDLQKGPLRVKELMGTRLADLHGKPLGMLLVPFPEPVRFTREDEAFFIQLGAFISVALQNHAARQYSERLATEMTQVFSALHDAVIVLSMEAVPIFANPAAVRMLGADPVGLPMDAIVESLRLTRTTGQPVRYEEMPIKGAFQGKAINNERFRFVSADNRLLTYSISAFPLFNDGEITGVVCVARDDTRKEELMVRLEQERSALKAIINSAPETILVVNENCRIVMSNPEAERLYGKPIPHGQPYESHAELKMRYPDGKTDDDPVDLPLGRTVFRGEVIEDLEMDIALPDGNIRHVLVNTSPIRNPNGDITGGVGIFHDITTRKKEKLELQRIRGELEKRVRLRTMELSHTVDALKDEIDERIRIEKKLRNSQTELREMSKRMLHALEADRQSVAKELHDSIGASLAAIKFSLEEKLTRMSEAPPKDIISLEQIVSYLMYTIKETKRISANLRPTMLDDLGLIATIKWFCREFKAFYKQIEVNQYVDITENEISESMKIVIFRIMQEAMNNAAKHGTPDKIDLVLTKTGEHVILYLEDNGVGFEPGTGLISEDPLSGHGLQGMRERAEICGGVFCLESHSGEGTRITVTLPAASVS